MTLHSRFLSLGTVYLQSLLHIDDVCRRPTMKSIVSPDFLCVQED